MAIGNIGQGLAASFSDYITSERERQRKMEDDELTYRQELIKNLVGRPDVNPAILGKALHELLDIQSAKTGKRKQKGGAEGFLGHTELPISQFLEGIRQGTTPIQGPTTEAMPMPQLPTQAAGVPDPQMAELKYKGFELPGMGIGASLDIPGVQPPPQGHQMPVDASKLAQASADMSAWTKAKGRRPVANQPLFRSPEEMAQQEGMEQGTIYKARAKGQRDADMEMWQEADLTPDEIKQILKAKAMGRTAADNFASYVYMLPDGRRFSIRTNTRTGETFDEALNPITIPPEAVRIGVAPPNQINFFQDDAGNVSGTSTNRYVPEFLGAESIPVAPDVRGRTSPEGPAVVIQGPDGSPVVSRFPRRGSTPSPGGNPFPAQSQQPVTPPGTVMMLAPDGTQRPVPAEKVEFYKSKGATVVGANQGPQSNNFATSYRQPPQGAVDQINAAQSGIQILEKLERTWDPRYTGPIEGPLREIGQKNPIASLFVPADPKFREFQGTWATARNELLRTNAGLTQTDTERQNTHQQIMMLNDRDESFLPMVRLLRDHFRRKLEGMQRNMGVGIPFGAGMPAEVP